MRRKYIEMIILTGSRCIIGLSGGGGGGRGGVVCFLANAIKNFHIFFVNPSLIWWANRLLQYEKEVYWNDGCGFSDKKDDQPCVRTQKSRLEALSAESEADVDSAAGRHHLLDILNLKDPCLVGLTYRIAYLCSCSSVSLDILELEK